jgi:hypothetical protein
VEKERITQVIPEEVRLTKKKIFQIIPKGLILAKKKGESISAKKKQKIAYQKLVSKLMDAVEAV